MLKVEWFLYGAFPGIFCKVVQYSNIFIKKKKKTSQSQDCVTSLSILAQYFPG